MVLKGNAIDSINELGQGAVKNNFGKTTSLSGTDKAFKRKLDSIEEVARKLRVGK